MVNLLEQEIKHKKLILHMLSALIPILILGVMFALQKVYPFGHRQIVYHDFWHQYYPFISDFWHKLREGGSLAWSWTAGGGHDYVAHIAYYISSPLNFLTALFPHEILREVLTAFLLVKISAAGLSMSIFLRCTLKKCDLMLPAFSSLYALCAFTLGYFANIMWFDTFAVFPLVMLGAKSLLSDGKYKLYVISLAAAILFNFYIGVFVCIFVAIMFAVHCFVNKLKMRDILNRLAAIAAFSAISIGMTALLTLPTYSALQSIHRSADTFPDAIRLNNSFADVLGNFIAFTPPTSLDGIPNLYSGMISVMLMPVLLFSKKAMLREKIAYLSVAVFLILSCNVNVLEYIWNGFNYTIMLPSRFSFIVSFVIVFIAYKAYLLIKEEGVSRPHVITMGVSAVFFLVMAAIGQQSTLHVIFAACLCAIYLLFFSVSMTSKIPIGRAMQILLFLLIMAELANTSYIGAQTALFTGRATYPAQYEQVQQLLDDRQRSDIDFYRTDFDRRWSYNDSSLYGYDGISFFSSVVNADVTGYYTGLGLPGLSFRNRFLYAEASPLTNAFLSYRYIISLEDTIISESDYLRRVSSADDTVLFENTRYLPLGFMVGEEVANYSSDNANPFKSQNDLFRMATGVEDDLFTIIEIYHADHRNYVSGHHDLGDDAFTLAEGEANGTFMWDFEMPADGSLYAFCRIAYTDSHRNLISLSALSDGQAIRGTDVAIPHVFPVGSISQGETVSFIVSSSEPVVTAQIYAGIFNREIFEKGFSLLSDETLELTEFSDTKVAGNITALEGGLLYTSIPHVNQWRAYVNGSETEIITIDGAMAAIRLEAGAHHVEFRHHNSSLTIGFVISTASLLVFLAIILLERKRARLRMAETHPAL